ncbi:MAG: hypothetical protein PF487_06690 [Bacteroidales bacterium]|jgi:hypothetical protein|nr:hypothetical protein [Bacteroidales bacterium]
MKNQLEKKVSSHLNSNKKVYLLGQDKKGIKYWLEEPSWDCDSYWGFGYVKTYNRGGKTDPSKCTDINSYEHVKSSLLGQMKTYDFEKGCFVKPKFNHNIYNAPLLDKTTFNKEEGWKLSELFNQFYLLKDMADYCHNNPVVGCNTSIVHEVNNNESVKGWYKEINVVMIPKITAEILRILTSIETK